MHDLILRVTESVEENDKESIEGDAENSSFKFDKSLPFTLQTDAEGWPMLPEGDNLRLSKLKEVIRSFITMTYSEWEENERDHHSPFRTGHASHNRHVAVPWSELMLHPGEYFEDNDVPSGITIKEPTKMRLGDLRALHAFWLKRQEQQTPALRFKNVFHKHERKGIIRPREGNTKVSDGEPVASEASVDVGSGSGGDNHGSQWYVD